MVKVYLGADHAGFKLKEQIKEILRRAEFDFEDMTPEFNEGDDYPDIALKVAKKVLENPNNKGILMCGTGLGMSITANKVPGIRAALCDNRNQIEISREHNDANILVLSGWFFKEEYEPEVLRWFKAPFEGGRHQRRIDKITQIEKMYSKKQ